MKMKPVAIAALVLIIIGIAAWYQTSHAPAAHKQVTDYKGILVANMGSMKCYTYEENLTTTSNGKTTHSSILGGYYNGTYFFHGKTANMEWWAVIKGNRFIEKISKGGKTTTVQMNLTKKEIQDMLLYEPVKLGLRALGSGTTVKSGPSVVVVDYTMYVPYNGNTAIMVGRAEVGFTKDYSREKMNISGTISPGNNILEKLSISAVVHATCHVPEWVPQLEGAGR